MVIFLKKLFFTLIFNSVLFLMLIIGIQNSAHKKKVNLLFGETVSLPISFIAGVSFIVGSITGSVITNSLDYKTDSF
tara:strand:- start:6895 stop:7125 length:231 start_codon:yes stop_codon:yes gene_type:complete